MTLTATERAFGLQFVRTVLGHQPISIDDELLSDIVYTLKRQEEVDNLTRDPIGNWEHRFEHGSRPAVAPRLDQLLMQSQRGLAYDSQGESTPDVVWPEAHRFALCLTHDVDIVSAKGHARRFARRLRRAFTAVGPRHDAVMMAAGSAVRLMTRIGYTDPLGHFERWLRVEEQHGFRSTWYFLPSQYDVVHVRDMDYTYADRVTFDGTRMTVADMMRQIDSAGWEIGLHGSFLSCTDASLLARQKRQVEAVIDKPVRSVRQHYLRYDAALTPHAHAMAGFESDSTQGFNRSTGFRAQTCFPYWCWDHQVNQPSTVLEIPLTLMDGTLLAQEGNLDRACQHAISVMDTVERIGGCLTLNWHPNYLNEQAYWETYTTILQEASRRGAWGCSASELYNWWVLRRGSHSLTTRLSESNPI